MSTALHPLGLAQALPTVGTQLMSVDIMFAHLSGLQSSRQLFKKLFIMKKC